MRSERESKRIDVRVTKLHEFQNRRVEKRRELLKRSKEFQAKEAHIGGGILAKDFGGDGRGLAGDLAGGGWGRCGDGEMDHLVGAENMC